MKFQLIFTILFYFIQQINTQWQQVKLQGDIPQLIFHETIEYQVTTNEVNFLIMGGQDRKLKTEIKENNILYKAAIKLNQASLTAEISNVQTDENLKRVKFAACQMNDFLYFHGGYKKLDESSPSLNSFCKVSLSPFKLEEIGQNKINRAEHTIICDKQSNKIWLFGGKEASKDSNNKDIIKLKNDLQYYDVISNKWVQQSYNIFDKTTRTIKLWDGQDGNIEINDFDDYIEGVDVGESDFKDIDTKFQYDCSDENATENKQIPVCRSNYSMVLKSTPANEQHLYLIGGQNAKLENIQDIWRYNIETKRWKNMKINQPVYSEYFAQQKARLADGNNFILMFGGYNNANKKYTTNGFAWNFEGQKISYLNSANSYLTQNGITKEVGFSISSFQAGVFLTGGCSDKEYQNKDSLDVFTIYYLKKECNQEKNANIKTCLYGKQSCNDGFFGQDCKQVLCDGSMCLIDDNSFEDDFCYHCFGNGTCANGKCSTCNLTQKGISYKGSDCSTVDCGLPTNCGGNGVCVEYYPVSSCQCKHKRGGDYCEKVFCLNDCSETFGTCVDGECQCQNNRKGTDCSIFAVPFLK